jgi:hypothetical protein
VDSFRRPRLAGRLGDSFRRRQVYPRGPIVPYEPPDNAPWQAPLPLAHTAHNVVAKVALRFQLSPPRNEASYMDAPIATRQDNHESFVVVLTRAYTSKVVKQGSKAARIEAIEGSTKFPLRIPILIL